MSFFSVVIPSVVGYSLRLCFLLCLVAVLFAGASLLEALQKLFMLVTGTFTVYIQVAYIVVEPFSVSAFLRHS